MDMNPNESNSSQPALRRREGGSRKNSRNKGKHGEREFASLLREHGFDARRGQQFSGGAENPDVVSKELAWLHFEIKRVEKLNLIDACVQAEGDSGGKPWVVAHRRNYAPWLITIRAEFFFELLREFQPKRDTRGETTSTKIQTPKLKRTEGSEGNEGLRGQASPFPPNDGGKDAGLNPQAHGGPEDYLGCGDSRAPHPNPLPASAEREKTFSERSLVMNQTKTTNQTTKEQRT